MLILSIHEYGRSFHLLISSPISFVKDLKLLSYRSFTCLIRITQGYCKSLVAIVKGVVPQISFSIYLLFVYKTATVCFYFFELILYLDISLMVFINCRRLLVELLMLLIYVIISSVNNDTLTSPF